MTALVKLAPWSLWMLVGTPLRHTISSTRAVASVVDSVERNGSASARLVNRSVTTMQDVLVTLTLTLVVAP